MSATIETESGNRLPSPEKLLTTDGLIRFIIQAVSYLPRTSHSRGGIILDNCVLAAVGHLAVGTGPAGPPKRPDEVNRYEGSNTK